MNHRSGSPSRIIDVNRRPARPRQNQLGRRGDRIAKRTSRTTDIGHDLEAVLIQVERQEDAADRQGDEREHCENDDETKVGALKTEENLGPREI